MAVKIRLRRMGQKKAPFYRIIVADSPTVNQLFNDASVLEKSANDFCWLSACR